jgi:hypothetical protein
MSDQNVSVIDAGLKKRHEPFERSRGKPWSSLYRLARAESEFMLLGHNGIAGFAIVRRLGTGVQAGNLKTISQKDQGALENCFQTN